MKDDFLNPLFRWFYERLGIPQATFKRDYHALADAVPRHQIDDEVAVVLDMMGEVATRAKPADDSR